MTIQKIAQLMGHDAAIFALAEGHTPHHVLTGAGDGWVVEWHIDAPELGKLIAKVEDHIYALHFLRERNWLLAGNMNGGVHWIDLDHPEQTRNLATHRKGVFAFHRESTETLLSIGGDGLLTRWDIEARRATESWQLSSQSLRSISYSNARHEWAIGASDGNIYLLDAATMQVRHTIRAAHSSSVFCLQYTPDGLQLVSGGRDAMLCVFQLSPTIELQKAQIAHLYTLNDLAFSPDGALFATASRDRTIKIWDSQTFELLKVIDTVRYGGHLRSVNRLLWTATALFSASDDRSAMIWQVAV